MRALLVVLALAAVAVDATGQITGVTSSRPRQRAVGTPAPPPPGPFPFGHGGPDVELPPTVTFPQDFAHGHASPYGGNRVTIRGKTGPGAGCRIVVEKNTPPTAVNVTLLNCITEASGCIRTYISDDGMSAVYTRSAGGEHIHVSSDAGNSWDVLEGGQALGLSIPGVFDPVTGFTYDRLIGGFADLIGAGNAGFSRDGVFEIIFYMGASNAPSDTNRLALIRWSLPPGFDPQNPPTPTIIDRIDSGPGCTNPSLLGCYTNVAIGDRYIVVVYGHGPQWQKAGPVGSTFPPNFRYMPRYAIIDTQTASAPVLGWVGDSDIPSAGPSQESVTEEQIDITPMGDGLFAFLRRKGGSATEPIFAVSAIPIVGGDFPNTGNGVDPLLSLNTAELSAFGIPSTSLAPFQFDKPVGAAKSILGFAAPWGTGLVDVITLGPPPQGVGPGTLNSLRRVRFTPGQSVGPLQSERLEDISEADYAAMGIDLDMTLHTGVSGQQPTLSYNGIAGACVAFFRQDLFDAATGTFVAGRFLTDQD